MKRLMPLVERPAGVRRSRDKMPIELYDTTVARSQNCLENNMRIRPLQVGQLLGVLFGLQGVNDRIKVPAHDGL